MGVPEDCLRVVHEVMERHGRLDILVNNAGVTVDRPMSAMTVDDWHQVLRVNLSGAFYLSKPALAHMLERGSGRIINISSIVAETGNIGQANYAASKSGLLGLTKSLAREAALALDKAGKLEGPIGLTVNAVTPGLVETDMTAAATRRRRSRGSAPRSPCAGWDAPPRSPGSCASSPPTPPPTSPARYGASTAATTCEHTGR